MSTKRANYTSIIKTIDKIYNMGLCHETSTLFNKAYRNYIKNKLKGTEFKLLPTFSHPYCESTGHITDGKGRYVYFNSGDFRYNTHWKDEVLVRTVNGVDDYKGGPNHYCQLCDIVDMVRTIINH